MNEALKDRKALAADPHVDVNPLAQLLTQAGLIELFELEALSQAEFSRLEQLCLNPLLPRNHHDWGMLEGALTGELAAMIRRPNPGPDPWIYPWRPDHFLALIKERTKALKLEEELRQAEEVHPRAIKGDERNELLKRLQWLAQHDAIGHGGLHKYTEYLQQWNLRTFRRGAPRSSVQVRKLIEESGLSRPHKRK